MDKKKIGLNYHDFLLMQKQLQQAQTTQDSEKQIVEDLASGGDEILEKKAEFHHNIDLPLNNLSNLCRVCGSPGNISLHTTPPEKFMCIKPTAEAKEEEELTIAKMISKISNEPVEKTDLLPQFICTFCLGYLQHAFNIRCQIKQTTKNFKLVQEIQSQEGSRLELSPSTQLPCVSLNQREIIEHQEEVETDNYWIEAIEGKTSKIKIKNPPKPSNNKEKILEHKCGSCGKRVYSIKALNQHTDVCIIGILATFFSQYKQLYSERCVFKISSFEYQMNALSLIYNTNQTLKKVAKKQKINLGSFCTEVSTAPRSYETTTAMQRLGYSPDNGYNSANSGM